MKERGVTCRLKMLNREEAEAGGVSVEEDFADAGGLSHALLDDEVMAIGRRHARVLGGILPRSIADGCNG